MLDDSMFAPLRDEDVAAGATDASALKSKPVPIIPVPGNAPPCQWRHPKYGEPVATWAYLDAEGRLVGYAARVEYEAAGERKKKVYPITYCRVVDASGYHYSWRACGVAAPRPLYNLPALLASPNAPVIVCEGEKKADAVPSLVLGYLGTTSMGGAQAPKLSDWVPLAEREVIIWPDHDEPGRQYAEKVAALAMAAGAISVATVIVPVDWPVGWDLADEIPGNGGPEVLVPLLAAARPWVSSMAPAAPTDDPPSTYVSFGPFRMTTEGFFFDNGREDVQPLCLSAPFEVLAQTRDQRGSDWGLLLRWHDPDGRVHQWAMPRAVLGGRGDELWRHLLRNGLTIASSTAIRNRLADYLGSVRVESRARSVTRIGWHLNSGGRIFVLPDRTFGDSDGERVLWQTETQTETYFNVSGSLENWREEIGQRCAGNSRLVMAVSTAFALPLLELVNEESGGFHLVGQSRTGKTVTLRVAGSVWGGGGINGFIRTWRVTSNGLEGIAELHSDAFLPLDEIGQVDAREAGEIAYMLANGSGKGRAGRDGSARRPAQWRLLFLSSGELSLADKMTEAGKRVRAGQEVRLVDIPADAGAELGIFEDLHGAVAPSEFAEILRDTTVRYYGAPICSLLEALTERVATDPDGLRALLETNRREFTAKHLPVGASSQVRSVCGRFALIAAAGSLATVFGLTGWPDDEAERAAGICFQAWLDRRDTAGDQEIETGIRQVIRFLEEHGSARFEPVCEAARPSEADPAGIDREKDKEQANPSPISGRTFNRAGFCRRTAEGLWQYMALPEAWRTEITKGFDPLVLAREMVDRSLIIPDPSRGTPARAVSVKGYGKARLYVFAPGILGHAIKTPATECGHESE
jgi:uncharacterized protein (DUF927 family)